MIYHVTTTSNWEKAKQEGYYEAPSLAVEGFIHASDENQVEGVLTRYYQNQSNLLLLHIDEAKINAEIKYELSVSVNESFPHIYGKINLDAVLEVETIR